MNEYIFTFGFEQTHNDVLMANKFVAVEAESPGEAREIMASFFGMNWAFQYNSRLEAGVDRFNLIEVLLDGSIK